AATTLATAVNKSTAGNGTVAQVTLTTLPAATAVGMFLHNTTNGSRAVIVRKSGSTLTLSQPLTAQALGAAFAPGTLAEDNAFTAGNAVQVEAATGLNIESLKIRRTNVPTPAILSANLLPTLQAISFLGNDLH